MAAANQFNTAASGAGFDPEDDQRKRALASGVNDSQALPNLDPGKIGGNPYGTPNPYSGVVPFPGNSANRSQPAQQQPEVGNPYRTPASAQGAPQSPAGEAVQRQARAAAAPQPVGDQPQQPKLSVTPLGTYQLDAVGTQLLSAAQGNRNRDQSQADRIKEDMNYYELATRAAEKGAAGGQLGTTADMASRAAGMGQAATIQAQAADTAAARQAFQDYLDSARTQERAELDREQRYKQMLQDLGIAQEQVATTRRGQDIGAQTAAKQREIERQKSILDFIKFW